MFIKIKAFPKSKKERIIKKEKDSFEVYIKEKPIMRQANNKIIELLSLYFKIPKSKIKIIKGSKQPNKILKVDI
ncbi:MAG: DUF167 family protein [Candidatus Nealsonbacteria bacterium]